MLGDDTGAEVDDEINKKDSIRDAVENNPVCTEVVIEERYGDRKYDDVGDKQYEHKQIPIEPSHAHLPVITCYVTCY